MAQLGLALKEDGDLLVYGCSVASGDAGQAFVANLAEATNADVAASVDATGAASLKANWTLEINSGVVTASSAMVYGFDYQGVLAVPRVFGDFSSIYFRPGQASYTWTYGSGNGAGGNATILQISLHDAGANVLTRGKFQYSTDSGSNWTDYSYPSTGSTNFVNVSGKIWRFLDNLPANTTTTNNIAYGFNTTLSGGSNTGTTAYISPDNAPTDISSNKNYVLVDTTQTSTVATLTPTDTGDTTYGYWAIDSQSVANLFTIAFDNTTIDKATFLL